MAATPRQKACNACADSKRRCDKQLPECRRCRERDVDCVYPQTKRRRRGDLAHDRSAEELPPVPDFAGSDALGSALDFGDWVGMETANIDVSLSDVMLPPLPTISAPMPDPTTPVAGLAAGDMITRPWFLQHDTWILRHTVRQPDCVVDVDPELYIRGVEEMLRLWVKDGHNSFIHPRLYGKTMPVCVRDAFVTLAAYTSCTAAVKETILQTAEERTSALLRDSPPAAAGRHGLLAHLARTQALFVYIFIQLFDGSVRMRASAEKHIPTLRRWVTQMWEVAKEYQEQDSSLGIQSLQWNASVFDREYEASSEMWKLWILTESVRRTHLIVSTIANSYQTMTKGWAECSGAVMITARRGLWEAKSAIKWCELTSAKPPLLVPALEPSLLMSQHQAEECDPFVTKLWGYFVGADKIQCWIDRGNKMSDYDLSQTSTLQGL